MLKYLRFAIAPAYLFACIILGGSAQGIWQNAALELVGLALLASAAGHRDDTQLGPFARGTLFIALGGIAVFVLQQLPTPSALWASGQRHEISEGYRLLGLGRHPGPLSLTPLAGQYSILSLIVPLALFCTMVRLRTYHSKWMAISLLAAVGAGILLGCLQVGSRSRLSQWYLYPETNFGSAVGFFANANHMGLLLILSLPFLAALTGSPNSRNRESFALRLTMLAACALVVLVGIALNGSFAAYGLAIPVLMASVLIAVRVGNRVRLFGSLAAILLLLVAVAVLRVTPVGAEVVSAEAATSTESRQQIFATTARAIGDFFPWGSGVGSFRDVYHLYEDPSEVTSTYVIHAHNDYLELALEDGLPGIVLMVAFLTLWGRQAWRVWRSSEVNRYGQAAAVASAAILAHSFVDFPLRTAAISACFAMCLGFLSRQADPETTAREDLRASRHTKIT